MRSRKNRVAVPPPPPPARTTFEYAGKSVKKYQSRPDVVLPSLIPEDRTVIYPKQPRALKDKSELPWKVEYRGMIYDGGGVASWDQYYHTRVGARISAFLHYHLRSWGGNVTIVYNR